MNPHMYRDGYTKGKDDAEVTKKALADLDLQLRYEGTNNVAAILMESIVGANGVILPPMVIWKESGLFATNMES